MRRRHPHRACLVPVCLLMTLGLLAGCGTTPHRAGPWIGNAQRDGPDAHPPSGLENVPDAQPKIEPVRLSGPNKPYEFGGVTYVPIIDDRPMVESGLASWYGRKYHGRATSSGEPYDMYAMTAAHRTLPIPSYARVRNPSNGRQVIVRVNDRGPFSNGRVIDLSYTAALKLGVLGGVTPVEVERITGDEIRRGAFSQPTLQAAAFPASPVEAPAPEPLPAPADPPAVLASSVPLAAAAPAPEADPSVAATAAPLPAAVSPLPPSPPPATPPSDTPVPGFWVQLGAFRERDGALDFRRHLNDSLPWLGALLAVFEERGLHKLQAGPYGTREEARGAADRIRQALQLTPMVVERRP